MCLVRANPNKKTFQRRTGKCRRWVGPEGEEGGIRKERQNKGEIDDGDAMMMR